MHPDQHLSRRERQILDILHARRQATAAEVLAALADPPSYSGVRALLGIMEQKGLVKHRRHKARYVYAPRNSLERARRSALKRVVSTFFQGSVAQAMAALLETADSELSEPEIDRLQELVEKARKEGR